MNKLCKSLGLQIICVTHSQEIIENSDKIFEVTIKEGISKIISKEV
jgi:chromosome segregation ATPase